MKTKTLQEQIEKFYKETGCQLKIKDGKTYYDGYLYLANTEITELPDNLVIGSSLDLRGTKISELPDNLVVAYSLILSHINIAKLPDNLVVGGNLFLVDTNIDRLPTNLVVGGYLDLEGTKITDLPDNLVVGGDLNLYDSNIAKLPDNLVVGGSIYGMSGIPITPTLTKEAKDKLQNIKNLLQWNVGGKTYIRTDGIFSVVDSHKGNVWRTHRIGKEETLYVVTDGEGHYAHGNTLKEAKTDLIYKINDRDSSSYENLSLDDEVSFEEAIAMYRTITGACSVGTRNYIENRLPTPHKKKYSIKEIIALTAGEYGSETFKNFFDKKK